MKKQAFSGALKAALSVRVKQQHMEAEEAVLKANQEEGNSALQSYLTLSLDGRRVLIARPVDGNKLRILDHNYPVNYTYDE